MSGRTPIVVSGALANRPGNGGGASVRMTWVEGLRRLGFDVWFVEQIARETLQGTAGGSVADERPAPVRFFEAVTGRFGLAGRCGLLDETGGRVAGVGLPALEGVAAEAAMLVNLGGHLTLPSLLRRFRRKAYVDLDPGFTQFWHAAGVGQLGLAEHDHFFTVGLGIGRPGCSIPTDGIRWHPLPPPVVLDEWTEGSDGGGAFTTIASWRGTFGPVAHGGRTFGLKVHEFRKFLGLPARVPARFEIALDIHPAEARDLDALRGHGWRIRNPRRVAKDPDAYRRYIQGSSAEFSAAQGIYVETASGWVSDRTVRYLAAGKPALVQETGVSRHLPAGEGLIAFRTEDEAVAGAGRIAADYATHRARALELAAEHFDSDTVLGHLLETTGTAP